MLRAFVLVIVGLAGDPEHGELFHKWGRSLVESSARLGVEREHLMYLADEPQGSETRVSGRPTRDDIDKAFDLVAKQATPEDVVFIVLIGHGTFDGRSAKFNLPGPISAPQSSTRGSNGCRPGRWCSLTRPARVAPSWPSCPHRAA